MKSLITVALLLGTLLLNFSPARAGRPYQAPTNLHQVEHIESADGEAFSKHHKTKKIRKRRQWFQRWASRRIEKRLERLHAKVDTTERCANIIYRDGRRHQGRVSEVTSDVVHYTRCDLEDGPKYLTAKREIQRIEFEDGRVLDFGALVSEYPVDHDARKHPSIAIPFTILSLLAMLAAGIIGLELLILAGVFAVIALISALSSGNDAHAVLPGLIVLGLGLALRFGNL